MWQDYDSHREYIVDMQEDWQTGALLVYNNNFERYEPFAEPFQPDGASYTVTNEFDMVSLMYDDGSMVYLENYGDGAFVSAEATGYSMLQMRGEKSYYDSTNGFWWSYGWDNWSFSIDGGSTWKEAPSLEIRVVEEPAPDGYVGIFDGREWTPVDGRLEFLDENFPQVGWLGMDQFYYDLYDGVGYDGEPLRLTVQEIYEFEDDPVMDRWGHWPAAGHEASDTTVLNGPLSKVILNVYGEWTDCLKGKFSIPNPSDDCAVWEGGELNFLFAENRPDRVVIPYDFLDSDREWNVGESNYSLPKAAGEDVLCVHYTPDGYSFPTMLKELQALEYCIEVISRSDMKIKNLAITNHANNAAEPGYFRVGTSDINYDNFWAYRWHFKELGALMQKDGQIQHYGCNTAGANPFHADAGNQEVWKKCETSWELKCYKARCMLATIANITQTTVFGSSDYQVFYMNAINSDYGPYVNEATDFCLEFGVDKEGKQVSYKTLDTSVWCDEAWQPIPPLKGKWDPQNIQFWDRDVVEYKVNEKPQSPVTTSGEETIGRQYQILPIFYRNQWWWV